jgi:hypothetical protein
MTKEALKLALEALEVANSCVDGYYIPKGKTHLPEIELAITAIKEALAQPEQEPVAWRYRWSVEDGHWVWNYATYIERQKDDRCEPLYTTPPQREWVGLTEAEQTRLFTDWDEDEGWGPFIEAIEAKLKEKNT